MKTLIKFSIAAIILLSQAFSQVSRTTVYNYWKNRVVPTTPSITSTWASFHNILDDGAAWVTKGQSLSTSTNFIGSTNSQQFTIRTNSVSRVVFGATGKNTMWCDSSSFEIPFVIEGGGSVNGANPYMQLKGYYIGAYRILNSTTGVEWFAQNQTISGSELDIYSIGRTSNPSQGYLKLGTRGTFSVNGFYSGAQANKLFTDTAGHLALGTTVPGAATFRMSQDHRGGGTGTGIFVQGNIATDVNTAFRAIFVQPTYSGSVSRGNYIGMSSSTPGMGTNTLTNITYYDTGTELAAATVTGNTYGYFCRPNVVATRNVWGFFANGTAPNMFKGPVTIASATASANGYSLTVGGTSLLGGINISSGGMTVTTKGINTTAGDAATINSPVGRFRKDTSGSSFTLTNSQITANSIIVLTLVSSGITAGYQLSVQAGAGSATITFETNGVAAAPNANCDVNFCVIN